jgi:pimeloyl-ACP methyl ester carboxylesterase
MRVLVLSGLVAVGCGGPPEPARSSSPIPVVIERHDWTVESDPGIVIGFREVIVPGHNDGVPVLLVHGAGGGGISVYDPPVPGYSLAEDLARAGHPSYLLDIRGWGRSTRPSALDAPPDANPPAVGSDEAVRDIAAVAGWIRARYHRTVAIVGHATGGHWAGMYAATHPDAASHLVMINALYGTPGPWSLRAALEDPDRPGELSHSLGAYTLRDAPSLLRSWDANIPAEDKSSWRDPRVAEAYTSIAIASDPTSPQRTPPSVRVPTGALRDSYLLASGTRLWDATQVRAATLVIRGDLDFWSRREDMAALRSGLAHARRLKFVTLVGATHFVFLDRPEHGRNQMVEVLEHFLAHE